MRPDDPSIDAAAKVIYEPFRAHRAWKVDQPYDRLDPIGKNEFEGIIKKALEAADAARQGALSENSR